MFPAGKRDGAAKGNNHNRALLNGKSKFRKESILTHPGETRQPATTAGAHYYAPL